jgi:hypothetical protein
MIDNALLKISSARLPTQRNREPPLTTPMSLQVGGTGDASVRIAI